MQKLVDGIRRVQLGVVEPKRAKFARLANGQSPLAMFITCADSRINPNLITQTDPGDLFIVRNVGNLVPPHRANNSGEAAAVEFAILGLGIRDIIVCGHTHCGAMQGLIDRPRLKGLPEVRRWLRHADSTRQIIEQNYGHLEGQARLTAAGQENVLVQLQNLQTLPTVAALISRQEIRLHGWMYKIDTGEVFGYHPDQRQFLPLVPTAKPPAPHVRVRARARAAALPVQRKPARAGR
jgi:carbonic anhydrase